jgi:exonuclease III
MPFFRQRPDGDRQKGNVIDNIKLSSFNVEGLRGNAPYLETILPFGNMLCLQEHWLWHYEQQDTAKFLKDYNFTIRSSDCNFPKTHYVRSRGYGGILIAWKHDLDNNVRPLNDGNERMVVVEIDCLPRPICLINCYMPTFGYPDTSKKFQDKLLKT